ncbi:nitrogen regulation protein NR(II) [Erythrobacter sp. JK5]|uniref:two-component system sensor histidine kinase NtrB n=1 Tax=Erythrobacter sp. JK5 TaxID=2829500 RepID=UPI001BA44D86|nr:ATP-binding protein [Erythrobacter sp. JK5]QUL38690.1 PAS domain-containing protein [Erythrobacter sp. JK5]
MTDAATGEAEGQGADTDCAQGGRPDAAAQVGGLIFAVLLVDPELRIVEANHAAENLFGTSAKRFVGQMLIDTIGTVGNRVAERLADPEAALVARDQVIAAGGTEKRVNLTVSPVSGYPGWRVVTLSEIAHEENARDDSGESSLGAPTILAHEIKNPLAAIRGAGQLVARKLPHGDKKLARMITDEVDRIARLIDRMQQLGSTRAEPLIPCNPHEAIRSAIATVRAAGAEGVTIREEFDPSLPPVMANRDALEQVLINLVSNARDAAMGDARPEIVVQTRFVSGLAFSAIRLGRMVRLPIEITVSDNGAGIDAAMREHVFEPFVSSKKSGQGLGLALVRKLVRDMNGSVSHERDSRAGLTHFRLHLPLGVADSAS